MIVGIDSVSQLPIFTEDRPLGLYRALPRDLQQTITGLLASSWTVKYAKTDLNTGALLLACCKCGRPINGWHPVADRAGHPLVLPNGRAAVAMGPLNHYRETRFAVHLPRIRAGAVYTVLHCADCIIDNTHREATFAIHVAAHDEQQISHRQVGRGLPPAAWAQASWKWGDADMGEKVSGPLGPHEGV